jgi:hypothetical protein
MFYKRSDNRAFLKRRRAQEMKSVGKTHAVNLFMQPPSSGMNHSDLQK